MANVKMTRQHFELIAEIIRDGLNFTAENRAHIARCFAQRLAPTNHNFDRERFIAAATREG